MSNEQIWDKLIKEQFTPAWREASKMWCQTQLDHLFLPRLENVSIPHWRLLPIIGKSPEKEFWYRLSRGVFNVNMRLRSEENLYYLEERDLFHDYFGHVPFLFDKDYTDYLIGLGNFFENSAKTPQIEKALSNLYWYTAEFGLIQEKGKNKVLGAGILSSVNELEHVCSGKANIKPFKIHEVLSIESYVTDGFQNEYFVLQNKDVFKMILKFLWNNF